MQERVLTGGHGLMVNGYYPVIEALARGLDIRLNQRFVFSRILNCWSVLLPWLLWLVNRTLAKI